MAGWNDLVAFVRVRYEVMRQADDELWFNLPTTGDRTQLVVVRKVVGTDDEPWAQIASPICKVGDAQLDELLALASEAVVGGIVAVDGVTMFRHSVPLDADAISIGVAIAVFTGIAYLVMVFCALLLPETRGAELTTA